MNERPNIDLNTVQSILDLLPMGVYVVNGERKIQWMNERMVQCFRAGEDLQPMGKSCHKEIFKHSKPCADCPSLKTLTTGSMEQAEIKSVYKGDVKYYLVTATPLRKSEDLSQALIIETIQDVTVQKKAEEELRRVNDFNSAIIDNAPVSIFTLDKNGKFVSVNPALATMSGLGAEAEKKLMRLNWVKNPYTVRSGLAEYLERGLAGEPFVLQDFPFVNYRGDEGQYITIRGVPLTGKDGKVEGLLCIIEDNTEKVKAQIQLIQDAKMSVIGRLLTGVAHELNNPLAAIAANTELACELFQSVKNGRIDSEEIEELRSYLDVIEEQAFRCKDIIKDMIDLTKKEGFEVHDIDLPALLRELLEVLNLKKLKIRLVEDIPAGIPRVKGDVNALQQCFLNILRNATDALEGREAAIIRIRVQHVEDFVKVEIEDNGVGIHDGLVDKIFEPFFSTKDTGKGVGLGLTLCYEFLKRMGANIEVESILGRGSVFVVTLPAAEKVEGLGK